MKLNRKQRISPATSAESQPATIGSGHKRSWRGESRAAAACNACCMQCLFDLEFRSAARCFLRPQPKASPRPTEAATNGRGAARAARLLHAMPMRPKRGGGSLRAAGSGPDRCLCRNGEVRSGPLEAASGQLPEAAVPLVAVLPTLFVSICTVTRRFMARPDDVWLSPTAWSSPIPIR